MSTTTQPETIAILGGTGDLGTGLAIRWARAGHRIVIGSRTLEKAQAAVAALKEISPATQAEAMDNAGAAAAGNIVVLTVPAEHQLSTLAAVKESLTGKILIDVTVPLVPPKVGTVQLPPEGSAGKRAQNLLGDEVMVVTAFQNISTPPAAGCGDRMRRARRRQQEGRARQGHRADYPGWHARLARRSDRELGRGRGAYFDPHPDQPLWNSVPRGHQDRRSG